MTTFKRFTQELYKDQIVGLGTVFNDAIRSFTLSKVADTTPPFYFGEAVFIITSPEQDKTTLAGLAEAYRSFLDELFQLAEMQIISISKAENRGLCLISPIQSASLTDVMLEWAMLVLTGNDKYAAYVHETNLDDGAAHKCIIISLKIGFPIPAQPSHPIQQMVEASLQAWDANKEKPDTIMFVKNLELVRALDSNEVIRK